MNRLIIYFVARGSKHLGFGASSPAALMFALIWIMFPLINYRMRMRLAVIFKTITSCSLHSSLLGWSALRLKVPHLLSRINIKCVYHIKRRNYVLVINGGNFSIRRENNLSLAIDEPGAIFGELLLLNNHLDEQPESSPRSGAKKT